MHEATMATLTIKNLPDPLYERLKTRAMKNRRSINSEAILAVERAVADAPEVDPAKRLATLRRHRERLTGVYLTDKALRAARGSGRA
jgi:plasmid stability protein